MMIRIKLMPVIKPEITAKIFQADFFGLRLAMSK